MINSTHLNEVHYVLVSVEGDGPSSSDEGSSANNCIMQSRVLGTITLSVIPIHSSLKAMVTPLMPTTSPKYAKVCLRSAEGLPGRTEKLLSPVDDLQEPCG
jgi:hypothetical protein